MSADTNRHSASNSPNDDHDSFTNARTSNACDSCRRRKTKCSGTNPCTYCLNHKLECRYTYVRKKRVSYKKHKTPNGTNPINSPDSFNGKASSSSIADVSAGGGVRGVEHFNARLNRIESTISSLTDKLDNVYKMNEALWTKLSALADAQTANVNSNSSNRVLQSSLALIADHNSIAPISNKSNSRSPVSQHRINDPMRISQLVQKQGIDQKARKRIMDEVLDLVFTTSAVTIFSPFALKWIKKITGENFKIFEPVVDDHAIIIRQLTKTLRTDFNASRNYNRYFFEKKPLVKFLAFTVRRLKLQSLLTASVDVCSRLIDGSLKKFTAASSEADLKLTNSEHLILSSIVCFGCVYVSGRIHEFNYRNNRRPDNEEIHASFGGSTENTVNITEKLIAEMEKNAMRNCFYYFHKLVRYNEGEATIVAILLLCYYLSSTVFGKCNYLILSVACKHAQKLGYQDLNVNYVKGKEISMDVLTKKMLWYKCIMFDRDVAHAVEKPPVMGRYSITDEDFLNITKNFVAQYCRSKNVHSGDPDLLILRQISFKNLEGSKITARKMLFNVLHSYATYSRHGFSLLINYFSFTLVDLLAKYSTEVCLDSVLKAMPSCSDDTVINDEDFLESFFKSLEVVNNLNEDFRIWESCLPENIRPDKRVDISMYNLTDSSQGVEDQLVSFKRRKVNEDESIVLFQGYHLDTIPHDSELIRSNTGSLLITQFKYYYNMMKFNQLAHKACYLLYKRRHLFNIVKSGEEQNRLENTFSDRMEGYATAYLTGAKNILRLSFNNFDVNCQIIYWGAQHYIIGAFYSILIHNMSRFVACPMVRDSDTEKDSLEELHLLIDCYIHCLSKPVFIIRQLDNNFVERFGKRMIDLCLANLKAKTSYDYDQDYKVIRFLAESKKLEMERSELNERNSREGKNRENGDSAENCKTNGNENENATNKFDKKFADNGDNRVNGVNGTSSVNGFNSGNVSSTSASFDLNFVNNQTANNVNNPVSALAAAAAVTAAHNHTTNPEFANLIDNNFSIGFSKNLLNNKKPDSSVMSHTFSNVARPSNHNAPHNFKEPPSRSSVTSNSMNNSYTSPSSNQGEALFTFNNANCTGAPAQAGTSNGIGQSNRMPFSVLSNTANDNANGAGTEPFGYYGRSTTQTPGTPISFSQQQSTQPYSIFADSNVRGSLDGAAATNSTNFNNVAGNTTSVSDACKYGSPSGFVSTNATANTNTNGNNNNSVLGPATGADLAAGINVPEIDISSDNFFLDINDLDPFSVTGSLFHDGDSPFNDIKFT